MKILFYLMVMCFQFIYIAGSHAEPQDSFSTAKIRGAYWGLQSLEKGKEQLAVLKEHGFNTALVKEGNYHLSIELWKGWGKIAEQVKIDLFPILNFAGPNERKDFPGQYTRYVNRQGKRIEGTPCPLDAYYWENMIQTRFEQLAHLSQSTHITGLVFDTEMYGGGVTIYRDVCFCDYCWQHFVKSLANIMPNIQQAAHLPQEQRGEYVITHDFLPMYEDIQKVQLQQILRPIEQRIHQINPRLTLGSLAYADSWFYDGLIRGLGTVKSPLNIFSENSYVLGYTPYVDRATQRIKDDTKNSANRPLARHVPGLWLERFFPTDIASQCYKLASKTDGYWFFSASSLWNPVERPHPYSLYAPVDLYWKALKNANLELCRLSEQPDSYQTSLPEIHRSSFYHEDEQRLETPRSLRSFIHEYFQPNILQSQVQHDSRSSQTTYRGRTLFHSAPSPKGKKTAEITIKHIPFRLYSDPTKYKLFDQHGWLLKQGTLDRKTLFASITLPHNTSEHYSLLTDSGMNGNQVLLSGGALFLEASPTFRVHTYKATPHYMLYVPREKKTVKLRAFTWGRNTALTIRSPNGSVSQDITINGYVELNIPDISFQLRELSQIPESDEALPETANLWFLTVRPELFKPVKDVEVYFLNEEFPYLIVPDFLQ